MRSTIVLEVEDIVTRAGDAGPIENPALKLMRASLRLTSSEFGETISQDREQIKKLGGLYVIGTAR
jgi:hypothetical protein